MKPIFKTQLLYTILVVVVASLLFLLEETIRLGNAGFGNKTLWDWMELLIIPFILALGAFYLEQSERAIERETADARTNIERQNAALREKVEREIAIDRQQEAALQTYLDRMADLLLEKNLRAAENEEARNVARTRTLTVLRGLDATRKGIVLKFLYEANLISKDEIVVDLSDAELEGTILTGANLRNVNLPDAKLQGACLQSANLHGANFHHANLEGAKLQHAILYKAELVRANLQDANLQDANLQGSNLKDAQVTNNQLKSTRFLKAAILPDGTKHD